VDFSQPRWKENLKRQTSFFWESWPERTAYEKNGKGLTLSFPQGKIGPFASGYSWQAKLLHPQNELRLRYRFRFAPGFPFVKGGKLPGLCGGAPSGPHPAYRTVTGGIRPDGSNGFSVRLMWLKEGQAVAYVYHLDQPGKWGDDLPLRSHGKDFHFTAGRWYVVKMRVSLNHPGKRDGKVTVAVNGETVFQKMDFRFRTETRLKIDRICFNTFYGGNTKSWAPSVDAKMYFSGLEASAGF
jgi:hypothetical protein